MTEPVPEGASYSPVPSYPTTEPLPPPPGSDSPASAWTSPSGAAQTTPYGPQQRYVPNQPYRAAPAYATSSYPPAATTPAAAAPKKKRKGLTIGLAAALVAVIGGSIGIGTALTRARESFTDEKNRVTIRAPYSWDGGTDPEAVPGPITTDEDDYELEDVYLSSFLGDNYVSIYIDDPAPAGTVDSIQAGSVGAECRVWKCESQGTPTPVTVGGHPGAEQVLNVSDIDYGDGRVEVLMTVRTPTMVVRALASRDWDSGDPPDPQRLIDILHSMTFTR